jgi:hypothetical protein
MGDIDDEEGRKGKEKGREKEEGRGVNKTTRSCSSRYYRGWGGERRELDRAGHAGNTERSPEEEANGRALASVGRN